MQIGSMLVSGWGPSSQPVPTAELQAAYASLKQQQQGDRRGALAGTKRTRAVGGGPQTFISLEDFEGSRKAEARLRKAAAAAAPERCEEGSVADGEGGDADGVGVEQADDAEAAGADEGGVLAAAADADEGAGDADSDHEEAAAAVSGGEGDGKETTDGMGDDPPQHY